MLTKRGKSCVKISRHGKTDYCEKQYINIATLIGNLETSFAMETTSKSVKPRTPIEHVIIVVGENRISRNLYGGYRPRHGRSIDNLLAKRIDGTPGANFPMATQQQATNLNLYSIDAYALKWLADVAMRYTAASTFCR